MTFRSPLPDVSIPDCSVYEYVFGDTGAEDSRIALIDGLTGAQTTLGELRSQIDATAAGLAERGFGIGDVAAVFLPNCSAFAVVLHGILRAAWHCQHGQRVVHRRGTGQTADRLQGSAHLHGVAVAVARTRGRGDRGDRRHAA